MERLLESTEDIEVWCIRHQGEAGIPDSRVRVINLDLSAPCDGQLLSEAIDLTIHFAGVTHAHDAERYWNVNHRGTMRLAECVRARGCRQFVYISTRCAMAGSGAYGESKLAAENELKKLAWESLLIIRPSEIYSAQGREGVDKLIALARRWHLTPWLFGNSRIAFAPLHVDDFAHIVAREITTPPKAWRGGTGVPPVNHAQDARATALRTLELCGPEDLTPTELATRIAKRYRAFPVPVWWPLFALFLKVAAGFNAGLGAPDQLDRLIGAKTAMAKSADRTGRVRFLLG